MSLIWYIGSLIILLQCVPTPLPRDLVFPFVTPLDLYIRHPSTMMGILIFLFPLPNTIILSLQISSVGGIDPEPGDSSSLSDQPRPWKLLSTPETLNLTFSSPSDLSRRFLSYCPIMVTPLRLSFFVYLSLFREKRMRSPGVKEVTGDNYLGQSFGQPFPLCVKRLRIVVGMFWSRLDTYVSPLYYQIICRDYC